MTLRNFAEGAAQNIPDGLHYFGNPGVSGSASDPTWLLPVWKSDALGIFDNYVFVASLNTSSIGVTVVRRVGDNWYHDGTLARDSSVTLTFTRSSLQSLQCWAMQSPADSTEMVLFVSGNHAADTPDTYRVDSIDLSDGESLTAIGVTIGGANPPTNTNLMAPVSTALSSTTVGVIHEDDGHVGVLSGDELGFTLTFNAAKVTAINTNIAVAGGTTGQKWNMLLIGTQLLLSGPGTVGVLNQSFWELTTGLAEVDEFIDVNVGGINGVSVVSPTFGGINGSFAIVGPRESIAAQSSSWVGMTFDLDALVANS